MKVWDYQLPKNWKPKSHEAWVWYLERKINYGDFKGLDPKMIKKYWNELHLDEGKRRLIESYFAYYGVN